MHRRPSRRWRHLATVVVTSLLPLSFALLVPGTLPKAAQAASVNRAPAQPVNVPSSPPNVSFPKQTYVGPAHGEAIRPVGDSHRPRHRLWFHDGAWWALMVGADDRAVRIHELLPDHSWRPTEAVVSTDPGSVGDALSAGDRLFVLAERSDGVLQLSRLGYDSAARVYRMDPDFPEAVTRRQAPRAALTMDAEGRLWAAWTADEQVWVSRSDPEGRGWSRPWSPTPDRLSAATREMAAVAAFGDAVAVMWSDQADSQFRLALHRLADPPDVWTLETPLGGDGMVDDHVSLSVVPGEAGGTLVAAVKTSLNDLGAPPDAPLIMVLVRRSDGSWVTSVACTVADRVTRPVVLVDDGQDRVHLFLQAPNDGGTVYHKSSSLADPSFDEGPGEPWINGPDAALADPTSTRQAVNARTGLVVLASDLATGRYWHGEQALPVPEGGVPGFVDDEPPSAPGRLNANASSGAVDLRWSPAADGDGWAPAGDRPPVAGYAVLRDGVQLGVTAQRFFTDSFPVPGARHEYTVSAIDLAGNRSEPVSAVVRVAPPPAVPSSVWWLVGGLGAAAAALLVLRWQRDVTHAGGLG